MDLAIRFVNRRTTIRFYQSSIISDFILILSSKISNLSHRANTKTSIYPTGHFFTSMVSVTFCSPVQVLAFVWTFAGVQVRYDLETGWGRSNFWSGFISWEDTSYKCIWLFWCTNEICLTDFDISYEGRSLTLAL